AAGRGLARARDRVRVPGAGRARRLPVALPLVSFFRAHRMTTNHAQFLSAAADHMKESAIRRMGAVLAAGRDIISFAPGYPAPETFPWDEFNAITADLL